MASTLPAVPCFTWRINLVSSTGSATSDLDMKLVTAFIVLVAAQVGLAGMLSSNDQSRGVQDAIAKSTDVAWLGRIAASAQAAAEAWRSGRPIGQPKDLRVAAYARLGELGTSQSLAEQKQVEDTLRGRPLLPTTVSLREKWTHPGWHMSDFTPQVLAQARASDGRRWVLVPADLLGDWQVFLVLCAGDISCERPKPVGPWSMRYTQVDATLTETAPGAMELKLVPKALVSPSIMDGTAPLQRQSLAAPETRELVLDDIERDSDGDGWTDIEERTLGLDPARRDTDGDRLQDAEDPAPSYAAAPADAQNEDVRILQRAVLTAFGLSESRWVLFARDQDVRKIEPWGLSAPVIYDKPLGKVDLTKGGPGGVFVAWKIASKNDSEAVVEISDWEGPLAAGGQNIVLRKQQNEWVVVARRPTWIS